MSYVINLNSITPAAPEGSVNVAWQRGAQSGTDSAGNPIYPVSAYVEDGGGTTNPITTEGDLIVGGADGAPGRLGIGSPGQVLAVIDGAPAWSNTSAVAAGITLFNGVGGYAPTMAGTGLTTAMNQSSTFSATDITGAGIFLNDSTSSSPENSEGVLGPYPASPCTVTAVFSAPGGNSYTRAGIVIAASPTAKLFTAGIQWRPGTTWQISAFNSPSSWEADLITAASFGASLLGVRVKDDGTNLTVYFSVDGYAWTQAYQVAKSASWLGSSGFNYLGAMIDTFGAAQSTTLLAWNITNP